MACSNTETPLMRSVFDDSIKVQTSLTSSQISWIGSHAQKKYRFQQLAFVFALPTALLNWGLVFFFGHWLHIGLLRLGSYTLISKGPQLMHCPHKDAAYLPQGTPDLLMELIEIGLRLVHQWLGCGLVSSDPAEQA